MRLKQLATIMFTTAALTATTTVPAKAAETDEAAMVAQAEATDAAYARIAERTIELREREHIAPDAETPQHIVDEVLQSEHPRRVRRDSTVTYNGMVLGKREIAVCAFNPYDCKKATLPSATLTAYQRNTSLGHPRIISKMLIGTAFGKR